jgi:AAA15 family ATPase/GTPase
VRLVNFSVSNFRSITAAHKVPISNTTILIGRNNEGKSNVLKALSFAMNALLEHAAREQRDRHFRRATIEGTMATTIYGKGTFQLPYREREVLGNRFFG